MTSGRTGTVKSLWCEPFRRFPSRHFNVSSTRAYPLYSFIYTLSLPSPFCQFSPPLSFPPLLHTAPSPRRPFSAPPLLHAAPSPRCPFSAPSLAQPSLPSPYSPHPLHPFDSRSKENHSRPKEKTERFVRKQPFKTVICALQTARQSLRNPPQKQKNADFSQIF